jgi:uncharacterized protein
LPARAGAKWELQIEFRKMQTTTSFSETSLPNGTDKIWAMLSHLSTLFGLGLLLPLVVYLAMRQESDYVRENAKEALNFHLSVFIYVLCCIPLCFVLIGVPLLIVVGIGCLVLSIIAALRASNGECYRYPLCLRLVK